MRLNSIEISGFKSFAKKAMLEFHSPIVCVVGPNGSGKSNVVESFRFVLGEQSMKSMRGKAGTDLIFKGSKSLPKGSRASATIYFNNKDKVFKLPNESGESIDLNYDIVSISREVYPDGLNKYLLNGSEVRLKDINNLLASVNIGSSGHHIISQGEADRILNASPKDRKEMVEDALGLKIYQYKIREAERKLEKTSENMKEVSMLRRENAPHLNFLKKQVEKFEKAKVMQKELLALYREYLKKESIYLEREGMSLVEQKSKIKSELAELSGKISKDENHVSFIETSKKDELNNLERKISEVRNTRGELERKLGRIEGMIELEEKRSKRVENSSDTMSVPKEEFEAFLKEANEYLEEAMYMDVLENIAPLLGKIKDILNRFARHFKEDGAISYNNETQLEDLRNTKKEISEEIENIKKKEKELSGSIDLIKKEISTVIENEREKEREKFTYKVKYQELTSSLNVISVKEENLHREQSMFENEIKEGAVLIGSDIFLYKDFEYSGNVDRQDQEDVKRKIERIKIKLEDVGSGGSDLMKEFEEVRERDAFLSKEMEDLSVSMESLKKLMTELREKIDLEFRNGITKINKEFHEFFVIMFGGGSANLLIVNDTKKKRDLSAQVGEEEAEEDLVPEQGIEINVSLPHKKVKELHALSGGERSLTSIALLFAMSQVNPPPFIVLDETDAALDESNSRKFGDMLEKLSKHSELVVVTHNRETMSRAGVLYGVTIGADGSSRLLSVKFEEAQAIAK